MEALVENGYKLEQLAPNFFRINFGEVLKGTIVEPVLVLTGVKIIKERTTCQCTLADTTKGEGFYKIKIRYNTNKVKPDKQRVTLTTDESLEIYVEIVGEVK